MAHYKGKLKANETANFSLGGRFITLIQTPSKSDINILDNFNREFFATTGNFSGFRFENTKLKEGTLQLNIKNLGTKEEDYSIFVSDTITLDVPAKVDNFVTVNAGASIGIDPTENTVKIDNNNNVIKLSDNTVKIDPSSNDELPTILNNPTYWFNISSKHFEEATKLTEDEELFSAGSGIKSVVGVENYKIIEDNTASLYYIKVGGLPFVSDIDRVAVGNIYINKKIFSNRLKTILLSKVNDEDFTSDNEVDDFNFVNTKALINDNIFLLNSHSLQVTFETHKSNLNNIMPFLAIVSK